MKQSKKGTKGKKGFFKSKKSLVAAALAALIALAGVTYAWFTWSVGLTGGTLKMDYVQIDAEFGVYMNLTKLFTNYARYFDTATPPVQAGGALALETGNVQIMQGAEIFVPFDLFQTEARADLQYYFDNTLYEPHLFNATDNRYTDGDLRGMPYTKIFEGVTYNGLFPHFIFEINSSDDTNGNKTNDGYGYKSWDDVYGSAVADDLADNWLAKLVNRYVQHELPYNTLQVGYRIKNLGAACYINIPDISKNVTISQATEDGAELAGYYKDFGGAYVNPAWGVARYGNYVVGNPNGEGVGKDGWDNGVGKGTYATGAFDTDSYSALYAIDDTNGVPKQGSLVEDIDSYKAANPGETLKGPSTADDGSLRYPLETINKAYSYAAGKLYNAAGKDVYPLTVDPNNLWKYDDNLSGDADKSAWEINVVPDYTGASDVITVADALIAGNTPISVSQETKDLVYGYGDALWAAYADEYPAGVAIGTFTSTGDFLNDAYDFSGQGNDLASLYTAGGPRNEYTALAYILYHFIEVDTIDFDTELGDYLVVDGLRTRDYDLALITDSTGLTVLHVQGPAFTYKTLKTAPSINLKYTVKYGEYLDNRFVGSQLYFENSGVVAVQNTKEAALDVFVTHGDLTLAVDLSWFDRNGGGIKISEISGLPLAYTNEIK